MLNAGMDPTREAAAHIKQVRKYQKQDPLERIWGQIRALRAKIDEQAALLESLVERADRDSRLRLLELRVSEQALVLETLVERLRCGRAS